jgi:hypothetical protein
MKYKSLILLLSILLESIPAFAQYDFEKYPAIKYIKQRKWKILKTEKSQVLYSVCFPGFSINNDALTLKYTFSADSGISVLKIYRNNKCIQKFAVPGSDFISMIDTVDMGEPIRIADINGDSLKDVKNFIPNLIRCGAYNDYAHVIYLFQNTNGKFTNISFNDGFYGGGDDIINRPERDFDGDGNYEIITETFTGVGDHNYWTFNLYNFKDGKLLNVNKKADYPIMYQLLYRMNYTITNKISRERMKLFSKKEPDNYFVEK